MTFQLLIGGAVMLAGFTVLVYLLAGTGLRPAVSGVLIVSKKFAFFLDERQACEFLQESRFDGPLSSDGIILYEERGTTLISRQCVDKVLTPKELGVVKPYLTRCAGIVVVRAEVLRSRVCDLYERLMDQHVRRTAGPGHTISTSQGDGYIITPF